MKKRFLLLLGVSLAAPIFVAVGTMFEYFSAGLAVLLWGVFFEPYFSAVGLVAVRDCVSLGLFQSDTFIRIASPICYLLYLALAAIFLSTESAKIRWISFGLYALLCALSLFGFAFYVQTAC